MILKKIFAFILRDLRIASSYRMAFFLDLIYIASAVTTFFFVAKTFGQGAAIHLQNYGKDYFSFVLIGLTFSAYLSASLNSFAQAIANERAEGTLELMLLSPTKISALLFYGSIGNFLIISFKAFAYILFGWLVFGFSLSNINFASTIVALFLTTLAFSTLGVLSAAFVLVFKRGNPINWAFAGLSKLFGGVFFPITVLPLYLQKVSYLLPITYSLEAMRKSIILGASISDISKELMILGVFFVILTPISVLSFRAALKKVKTDGSLLYS